jgi:serine/threonine protein kinase
MTRERWQRLDEAIVTALESPPVEREAAIARVCGSDDEFRTEALSLLAAVDASHGFLGGNALDCLAREMAGDGWRLQPGERVGPYTVDRLLGTGGSGEVWRARDERLQRDVAIKVLLRAVSGDSERLRRFAEEARSAGALNHPNILSVYDVGEHHGVPFLVTECVEGQSLRSRLEAGPIGTSEAVAIALQVARGLVPAHARGIVHRDLKPDNLRLRTDGVVKILDFGLAKPQMPPAGGLPSTARTVTGVIAGTPGYMAPEQVRGEAVDARADLFALGAILYEMLGGRRPFTGSSTMETLHAILATHPPDIATIVPACPPALAAIVTRLLQKQPDARFQSASDLVWALEVMSHAAAPAKQVTDGAHPPLSSSARPLTWAAAAAALAMLAAGALWILARDGTGSSTMPLVQYTWSLPDGLVLDSAPVPSPDGRRIVFAGAGDDGRRRLWLKELGALHAVPIAGTDAAVQPFWKPDSQSIGFFARGVLMKVAVAGGAPIELAPAVDPRGGTWGSSGTIVFAPDLIGSGLAMVSEDGGAVEPATLLDAAYGDNSHRWPVFLPDGVHFLYFVRASRDDRRGVYLASTDRAAIVPDAPIFRSESEAAYAPAASGRGPGDLLSVRDGRIEARPFDEARLALAGDPRVIDFAAGGPTPYHAAMLGASADAIAFTPSPMPFGVRLGSVAQTGGDVHVRAEREPQGWPRLSPDARLLARQRIDAVRGTPDIWVEDLAHDRRVRVTMDPQPDMMPVWSPDSRLIAYVTGLPPGRPGPRHLRIAAADGTGVIRELACPGGDACEPTDWTRDGRYLIVTVRHASGSDVWKVPAGAHGDAEPILAEPFDERDARLSPDGRWIAFVSNEQRRAEVFVRSLSGPPFRTSISGEGGDQPVWSRDGEQLYFVDPHGRLQVVAVSLGGDGRPRFGAPAAAPVPPIGSGHWGTQYDVTADGRVYFIDRETERPPNAITVVLGWRALIRQ